MTMEVPRPSAPYARRWAALPLLLTAVFMDMVDSQVVNIALPTIQRDLGAQPAALQWTATGYTLAFALSLITGGRLGDRFGQRALFMVGSAGFGLASLGAGVAPGVAVLLAGRVAQGVCAGLMVPQVMSFIRSEFRPEEQGRAMGFYGMTFPIGGLAGPLLGGVLTQADLFGWHWRTVFVVNVPLALAAAVGTALVMPAGRHRNAAGRPGGVDLASVLVLAAALLAVLYPLITGAEQGWPTRAFLLLAAALPLGVLFVARQRGRERRGGEPLVPLGMFRSRAMSVGILVMLIFYCGMGAFFVLALHLQDGLAYSPLTAALTMLPATFGIVAGNAIGMPMAPRLGRRLPIVGLGLLLVGTASMATVIVHYGNALTPWALAVPVLLYGAGLGLGASSLMLITLTGADAAGPAAGAASGVVNTVVQLGMAAGPATIGTAFFSRLAADGDFVAATRTSLLIALALFASALLGCLLLPPPAPPTPATATAEIPAVPGASRGIPADD